MGIPSYYKSLVNRIHGIVYNSCKEEINWLWIDFNCIVYHCLHRKDSQCCGTNHTTLRPYPGDDDKALWEKELLESVVQYCTNIVKKVSPTDGVFIGVDGIVPMAKMRQQRVRRFKSAWMRENILSVGEDYEKAACGPQWDTNAITPGTEFMEKLFNRMTILVNSKKGWKLSSSFEPGEGEHKIMEQWRTGAYPGNYAVYGLDADLIVLSLLNRADHNVWLFREVVEAGVIQYNEDGEEKFCWFDVVKLHETIFGDIPDAKRQRCVSDYCCAMSLLGNDFVPSALGLKIRDKGYEFLSTILRKMWADQSSVHLVEEDGQKLSYDGLCYLFKELAESEEGRICASVSSKIKQGNMSEVRRLSKQEVVGHTDWPLYEVDESVLVRASYSAGHIPTYKLVPKWKEIYLRKWFSSTGDSMALCGAYLYGLQWIWAYYTGNTSSVCYNWHYPWSLPPLWCWLRDHCKSEKCLSSFPNHISLRRDDICPEEHIALVLPLESWSLVRGPHKNLPMKHPWLFPSSYKFFSAGKRWFWETEAEIPVLSIAELKRGGVNAGC